MTDRKKERTLSTYARNRASKKELIPDRLKFIKILLEELEYRRRASPSYSMRDYARDLRLDKGHLSRILKNQKGLSRQKADFIASRLNIPFNERKVFLRLVSATCARSLLARNLAKFGLKNDVRRLI